MAVNQVGSVTFDLVEGAEHAEDLRQEVELQQRPGIDGHDVLAQGDRGPLFIWPRCYKWSTSWSNACSHLADVAALQGELVTVYDEAGEQYQNVLVVRAKPLSGPRVVIYQGSTRYQTVCRMELQRML